MKVSEDCQRIKDAYLDYVENMGRTVPRLFDARRSVENFAARVADLQNKIRLERASSAATRVLGPVGAAAAAVITAIGSAEKTAQLQRELATETAGLADAETLVAKLEEEIRGYQWGIDDTPDLLARQGCAPL